jgi:hypothetical protein
MNPLLTILSLICGVVLCATAVSIFAAYRTHRLLREIDAQARQAKSQHDDGLQPLRETMDALSAQVRDLRSQPAVSGIPKAGFNLSKRSQALRMHRQGAPSREIASSLDLPRQEVELLLKVHGIVLQNV